jgi:hypothetical protein
MSSVSVSNYRSEQLFSLKKNVKSRTRKRRSDEYLERSMRKATEIKPDIERLIPSNPHYSDVTCAIRKGQRPNPDESAKIDKLCIHFLTFSVIIFQS